MIDVLPFDPASIRWIDTDAELAGLIAALAEPGVVAVYDIESTGLDERARSARIVTASITLVRVDRRLRELDYPLTYAIGLSHPDHPFCSTWRDKLKGLAVALAKTRLVGQNIRFDARWTHAHTGVDLSHAIAWDTGLSSHLLDENTGAGLKSRACSTFGIEPWADFNFNALAIEQRKEAKKLGIAEHDLPRLLSERVPYYQLMLYNAQDTYWTWRLMQRHLALMGREADARAELIEDGSREAVQMLKLGDYQHAVMLPAVRTLTRLEQRGFLVDTEWCRLKAGRLTDDALEAFESLETMRDAALDIVPNTLDLEPALEGVASYEPTAGYFAAWAELMCRAGRLRVGAMTKQGAASWTKEVLNRQARSGSEAAQALLTYRQSTKQSQFLRGWADAVSSDGAIHSTYNYYRVVTGRLSSSDPNMQQVTKDLRPAFVARPGFVLVDADFSQIELRVAAEVAQCEPMIAAFQRGDDLHTLMAATISGVDPELVTPQMRQAAKAANFGFLYGMGAHKFVSYAADMYGVTVTEEEAEQIRKAFFGMWDGLAQWHRDTEARCAKGGYVTSPLGRVRRLPGIHSDDEYLRSEAARQAINSPVQSMASDLMLVAAETIDAHPDIHPLALVHDAIIAEVPAKRAEELALFVAEAMEGVGQVLERKLGVTLRVPLVADVAVGRAWSRGTKLARRASA